MAKGRKSVKKKEFSLKMPLKEKNLKIIDHLGTLYATFDGSSLWKIDRTAFNILRLCNGKKTVDQLTKDVSRKISHKPKEVKPVIVKILNELERMKFIKWV